jgi:leucyl-tRNA---protein transferase
MQPVCDTGCMSAELPDVEMLLGPEAIPLGRYAHACSYLPFREASQDSWLSWRLAPDAYKALMDRGLRRSGYLIYDNVCAHCKLCVPMRVPTDRFKPSKSQRRVLRRNAGIQSVVQEPRLTIEKHELYCRYLDSQHQGSAQSSELESMREFLYSSCVATVEVEYRTDDGRLVGVSICDVGRNYMSSVYHFFDPAESRRSIGVYSILNEINLCRDKGIPHYYLGYWIKGCATMDYKAQYRPHELLINGNWTQPDA